MNLIIDRSITKGLQARVRYTVSLIGPQTTQWDATLTKPGCCYQLLSLDNACAGQLLAADYQSTVRDVSSAVCV